MKVWPLASFLVFALAAPSPAFAWGKTGHRVVAAIADTHLSGLARARVQQILGSESLDEASTWPDEMRSSPDPFWRKTASPWHYVTVGGYTYDHAPEGGDAITALNKFAAVLRNPNASKADQQLALRFIVHIVGDLHQPLHVGKGDDRGGNDVKVTWFGHPTNLHAVWDSALVDDEQLSFSEFAQRLERRTTPSDIIDNWVTNPAVWMAESAQIRDNIYPDKPDLSYDYVYKAAPIMRRRLQLGGIRLAAYLNELFAAQSGGQGR